MSEKTDENLKERIPWRTRIERDLKIFQAGTGLKTTVLGIKAINNSRLWERLIAGGKLHVETADELYEFMAAQGYHFNEEGRIL